MAKWLGLGVNAFEWVLTATEEEVAFWLAAITVDDGAPAPRPPSAPSLGPRPSGEPVQQGDAALAAWIAKLEARDAR